jgi:hypothetical protein
MLSVCLCNPLPINFLIAQPDFVKLGMYFMAPKPMCAAYFLNPFHQSECLYVYPSIVARQRLGKNVTTATITDATIEELLDTSFSMRSVSYQKKMD